MSITFHGYRLWPLIDDSWFLAPPWAVALHHDLSQLKTNQEKIMTDTSKLQASAAVLEAKVDGLLVVLGTTSATLKTVSEQLAAANAANDPAAQKAAQEAIDAVVAGLDAESAKVDAANPPPAAAPATDAPAASAG